MHAAPHVRAPPRMREVHDITALLRGAYANAARMLVFARIGGEDVALPPQLRRLGAQRALHALLDRSERISERPHGVPQTLLFWMTATTSQETAMPACFFRVLLLAFALCALPTARADEVRVLAAGAAKHALESIAPAFERASGHTLRASYDTVGAQRDRVRQAAPGTGADVVILSDAALQALRAAQRLQPGPAVDVGRVLVSLAAPASQPEPAAIGDAAQLRAALLAASSIAYADPARGATAGTHFAKVLDALAIRAQVADKLTVLPFGVDVIAAVAQGRYALGVSQSSEIMGHPGVRFVGALPAPYAQATAYGAALASDSAAGRALLAFLAQPLAQAAWRESGFAAP